MSNILHFPRHMMVDCICQRCNGVEYLDLPTACPGRPMTLKQMREVDDGTIDYIHGYGWVDSRAKHPPTRKTSYQLYLDSIRSRRCNTAA